MTTTTTTSAITRAIASTGSLRLAAGAAHAILQGEQAAQAEPHWYAAYTCAQHEKRVAEQFSQRAVEHFLPLYSSVRRWKDRRVRIEMPLFPGYVFVRLALRERLRVLQVPSVVRLVGFGGLPAALPDEQVEILRAGMDGQLRAEPHPFLTVGRRVRVVHGPLAGMEGIIVRKKKQLRFVVSLELIMRSMSVEISDGDLMPLV
jgi:transcription antitermination factor NusG